MAESLTPKKIFKFIKFTPTTKKTVCVICGEKVEKSDYRRKLFHGTNKTDYCLLIEKYLEITIAEDSHTDTVCRKCSRDVKKIEDSIAKLKNQYSSTLNKLLDSHGKVSSSFKRQCSDETTSAPSRKALFLREDENVQKEQDDNPSINDTEQQLLVSLKNKDYQVVAKVLLCHSELEHIFKEYFLNKVQKEISCLASKATNSILRRTTLSDLQSFNIKAVITEFEVLAPTFLSFLKTSVTNPSHSRNKLKKDNALLPGIVSAGAKLLFLYNQDLNAHQYLNSLILWKGGCKKSAFTRLNGSFDCFSYQTVLNIADRLGQLWDIDLLKWQEESISSCIVETRLLQQVYQLQQTIDFLGNEAAVNVDLVLQLSNAELELEQYRKLMPPGYYFVGDNVDMTTKVRNMTLANQHKGHHMFQICAYENRVSGNHLQNETPIMNADSAPFDILMPCEDDRESLANEFAFHVARIWTEYLQYFKPYRSCLPDYLPHPYIAEMKKKSNRVNMGVLMKSEQYNEDMTDIVDFIHKYVPGHDSSDDWTQKPIKTLSGGDYLTFERHKQAQSSKRNGRTPTRRLEGLVPKMEEFHNQGELLKVIWQLLYSTNSAKDNGTLFSARNVINARNVTKDPSDNFYASSDLIEKATIAYILTGAMKYFGMDTLESEPTTNLYSGTIGDMSQMKSHILQHARKYVDVYTSIDVPKLPDYGPRSNNLSCRYCDKKIQASCSLKET